MTRDSTQQTWLHNLAERGLDEQLLAQAAAHAPAECCGVIVNTDDGLRLHPCANVLPAAERNDRFVLSPADQADAEDAGTIVAIYHSHPNASADPSEADLVQCTASGLPWIIIGWPSGVIRVCEPGYHAPLIGRQFTHGLLDCYTLIRDYYRWHMSVELPDFERADEWWKHGQHLYTDNFASAGFEAVTGQLEPQPGDVILMQVHADVPNHAGILSRPGVLLHHLHGRLSEETVYSGYWQRHTTHVLRHRSKL
jgi:proteasome lid subunit RPN8/RPN11